MLVVITMITAMMAMMVRNVINGGGIIAMNSLITGFAANEQILCCSD